MNYYRQGDVIISPRPKAVVVGTAQKDLILAEGELTGHAHRITSGIATLYRDDGTMLLKVDSESTLTHEEHKPIVLPVGLYDVRIQREYTPDGWAYVAD